MATTWSEITKDKVFQSLPPEIQQQAKVRYFEKNIAPKIKDGPVKLDRDMLFQAWMEKPDDSGQSYFTSALSSVGRGAASIVPNVVGGIGYLTNSQGLIDAGDSIEGSINEALPVNPIYQDTWGMKAFNAGGQAIGMLATGGTLGLGGRVLGGTTKAAQAFSQTGMLTQGFLSGARGGGQSADAMGLSDDERILRAIAGGSIEFASERFLFGMGTEMNALGRITGAGPSATGGFIKAMGTEAGEEAAAGVANNLTDIAMAPEGYRTPGIKDIALGALEDASLGAVGGGVFGGANLIMGQRGESGPNNTSVTPQNAPATAAAGQAATASSSVEPMTPIKLREGNKIYYRDENGAWSETGVPPPVLGAAPLRPLDPTDPFDSDVLTKLEARAARNQKLVSSVALSESTPVVEQTPPAAAPVNEQTPAAAPVVEQAPPPVETQQNEAPVTGLLENQAPEMQGQEYEFTEENPPPPEMVNDILEEQSAVEQIVPADEDIVDPMEILRVENESLPDKPKSKWTPEVYTQAQAYFDSGDMRALDGLTAVQKQRIVKAMQDTNPDMLEQQTREDAGRERRMVRQEQRDRDFNARTTFQRMDDWSDRVVQESRGKAFSGLDPVLMAAYTWKAGRAIARGLSDVAAWSADMVKEFGETVRPYLQAAWNNAMAAAEEDRQRFGPRAETTDTGIPATAETTQETPTPETAATTQTPAVEAPPAAPVQPEQPAPARSAMATTYRPFLKAFEKLRESMKLAKSARDERTVEGQPVPAVAYDVRTDDAMAAATENFMDELSFAQIGGSDIKTLLSDGTVPGSDMTLSESERAILGRHMIKSGRFVEFGVLRAELLPIMQELAGNAGMTMREWQKILDPVDRIKESAQAVTNDEFKKVSEGQDIGTAFDELEAELENLDKPSPEAQAKIDAVARKLRERLTPDDIADRMNRLFEPQDKTLAQRLYEDGVRAIADAFFRGGPQRNRDKGTLEQGAAYVNSELTELLNEALDALGIQRADETKDPNQEYRRLVQQLGLDNMRDGKMLVIDEMVRERINEYLERGAVEFADDLINQWEKVSAVMTGKGVSNASMRRIINGIMREGELTISTLANQPNEQVDRVIRETVATAMGRVRQAGNPEAGGITTQQLADLETNLSATMQRMVADQRRKAEERRAERERLRNSPAAVTERANDILNSMAEQMSDTPPAEGQPAQRDELRSLISEALTADEDMMRFRELAMDIGVAEDVAASLELVILEARRRKEAAQDARRALRRQESRAKAIEDMVDRLAGRKKNKPVGEKLAKFLANLKRADEYRILDKDFFAEAFAHAFDLHSMTPAVAQVLRESWQKLQALDAKGRRKLYGMARETEEMRFLEAVNAVAPGARWDNLLFNQYQAGVLSSISSMFNQFSGVFRVIAGVDAFARTTSRGDLQNVLGEWVQNNMDLIQNLPLILTGAKGEALGHLPSEIKGSFKPTEQVIQRTGKGQKLRIRTMRGSTITVSETTRKLLRLKELWTWRTIRGAEAISGITDSQARFRDVLTDYYKRQGLSASDANARAREDIRSNPAELAAAEAQARQEQENGEIGTGAAVIKRRVQEIIARNIEERLNEDLMNRVEKLTAASQFKTVPSGFAGYSIYSLFNNMAGADNPASRVARFFFLFGRFLGHTVDVMMAYAPGFHIATLGRESDSKRNQIIRDTYGDIATYNRQQHGKAAAGTAFLLANGILMALAEAMAGDDEEPFYQIFGNAPLASREQKEALMATGKWQEGTIRILGTNIQYSQIPELAALLTALGNASDYAKFSQQLYTKKNEVLPVQDAAIGGIADVLTAPIKRSTYRQYFDAMTAAMSGRSTDAFANIVTNPVGGFLRMPVVVDLDKTMRQMEGAKDAKGFGQNLARRIPFVHVGDVMMNSYGEKLPGLATIMMFPDNPQSEDPDIVKAATINVETGTVRGMPKLAEMVNGVETTNEQQVAYAELAGRYYVESLIRNEAAVRRAFNKGGPEAAKKVVSNISAKANAKAKEKLGFD